MKALFSLVVIAFSLNSTAAIVKTDCNFQDYQYISTSVSNLIVTKGENLKNEVLSVLQQEMGPTCKRVTDTVLRMGIPGRRTVQYELTTGNAVYTIIVGRQVEARPTQWVSLAKTKATR